MEYPLTQEQFMKLSKKQLKHIVDDYELNCNLALKVKELRADVFVELKEKSEAGEMNLDEVIILTGEHGAVGEDQIYKSPSGTEILIMMEKVLEDIEGISLNSRFKNIEDFGYTNDDYEDEEESSKDKGEQKDQSGDRSFNDNFNVYNLPYGMRDKHRKMGVIAPDIFFQFIKSKLNETQKENLRERINSIAVTMKGAIILEQQGLAEELTLRLSSLIREQEMAVIGCNKYIPFIAINFFISKVNENNDGSSAVKFDFFKRFPRPVPEEQAKKIKEVMNSKVFDQLYILYNSPAGEQVLETHKEKITKKDPIVFGALISQPDKLYFICDWIDGYCDITLDKFIEIMTDNPEMLPEEMEEVTPEFIDKMIQDINKSSLRLKKTNVSNYRKLIKEEDEQRDVRRKEIKEIATLSPEVQEKVQKGSWFKRFIKAVK